MDESMDTLPAPSSIPYQSETAQKSRLSAPASSRISHILTVGFTLLFAGLFVGALCAAVIAYVPYDRVVVYGQPKSISIRVTSVKLSQGGFVMVYGREPSGLSPVGGSWFLPAGYYRDIVIPLDIEAVVDRNVREFIVRLYHDNGDAHYTELDRAVTQSDGSPYEKEFNFIYPDRKTLQYLTVFRARPITTMWDYVIP